MYTPEKFIAETLDQFSWYDLTEEYDELLSCWYGDDLTMFDSDDEDLALALMKLRNNHRFWRCGPHQPTKYQKLRLLYDSLLESFMELADDNRTLREENAQLAAACRKNSERNDIATEIKGGRGPARERRDHNDINDIAA